jgi:hypothetical protein
MSRNQFNTSNALKSCSQTAKFLIRQAPAKKPYCKVCHDAGKPESDYTSHHVRSLPDKQGNSKITCPTLLNTECRFCYDLGHTAKFCPVLANKKKAEERLQREEQYRTKKPVEQQPKQNLRGGFSALLEIEDDDNWMTTTKKAVSSLAQPFSKEEWPTLGQPSQRIASVPSYASAIAKQVPITASIKQQTPIGFQVLEKGAVYEKAEIQKPMYVPRKLVNWATNYSSDEEDDESEYVDNSAW